MTSKTRKHIWPVALVSLAVFGLLAAAVAWYTLPTGAAQAHGCDDAATPQEQAACVTEHVAEGIDDPSAPHDHAPPPNNRPIPSAGGLEDGMAAAGQMITVDVSDHFTDPDGDDLTITAMSSDESVATVSVMDNMVMVTIASDASVGETATITVTATDPDGATASDTFMVMVSKPEAGACDKVDADGNITLDLDACVKSSSTTSSATVEIKLIIESLDEDVSVGGALVLYLEDDYQMADSISASDVYFVVTPGDNNDAVTTGSGSRVYATENPEIETDDHFTKDKKDYDIRVSLPDLCTSDTSACQGRDGLMAGDMVTMVIQKSAGIKNPPEAGNHSTGYLIIGPADAVPGSAAPDNQPFNITDVVSTVATIGLSDVDNSRGYELIVTGSGFNNGVSAAVHVLYVAGTDPNDKSTWPSCAEIITEGTRAGIATVGSDDKVAVSFEVTVPTFGPGNHNYICMVDGEGLTSSTDVEDFNLEPSIRIVPSSASAGDSVTVFAQDYPSGNFDWLEIADQNVSDEELDDGSDNPNYISGITATNIGRDGSATVTFDLPGSINNSALEGTVRIDASWGGDDENAKITITGSQLSLSKAEALPNELIPSPAMASAATTSTCGTSPLTALP